MTYKLTVLIVDDDRRMAYTLADILELSCYRAVQAFSAEEAVDAIAREKPDCVLTDVRMPGMNGVELFREIRKTHTDLPVVLMTAYASDDLIEQGLQQGVLGLLTKPLEIVQLLDFLAALARQRCLAVVDDDPEFCRTLADILTRRGFKVKQVSDPHAVLPSISADLQAVLLDMKLNSIDGSVVIRVLREQYPDLPVLLITGYRREMMASIEKALEMNAFACLYKPLDIPQLIFTLDALWQERLKRTLQGKHV